MRKAFPLVVLLCCALFMALECDAAGSSPAVTLTSSVNPSALSAPLTLTATLNAGGSGKVTFFDGATILGFGTASAGQATLVTPVLPAGIHSLRAHYSGDGTHPAGDSAFLSQTVRALPASAFQQPVGNGLPYSTDGIVADFNGDGKPDVIIGVNIPPSTLGVGIFLGKGDGTFLNSANYPGRILAVADVNGDGILDFIAGTPDFTFSPNVVIFLGNGDGTFRQSGTYALGGVSQNGAVTAGDFNNDGKADLASEDGQGNIFLVFGNGDGSFQPPVNSGIARTFPSQPLRTADLNGDGKADLYTPANIYLGNGDGTFQPSIGTTPAGQVGDLNGDGIPDFISSGSSLSVSLGNGDGTFRAPLLSPGVVQVGTSASASVLLTGDFNGDGKSDAITISSSGVWLSLGNGDGTLQPPVNFSTQSPGPGLAGDFNGDGRSDFAVYSSTLGWLTFAANAQSELSIAEARNGNFTPGATAGYAITVSNVSFRSTSSVVTVTDALPTGVTAQAMSGSGWNCTMATLSCSRTDSLAPGASYPPIELTVALGANVPGTIVNTVSASGGFGSTSVNTSATDTLLLRTAVVTLSASSNPAILGQPVTLTASLTAGSTGRVGFYDSGNSLGSSTVVNGQATLTTALLTAGSHSLQARFVSDASSPFGSASATLPLTIKELPTNGFLPVTLSGTQGDAVCIAQGDFNGDGKTDLVISTEYAVAVLPGNGNGTFGLPITTPSLPFVNFGCTIATADFNGDGKADLLRSGSVFLGNGDGTFKLPGFSATLVLNSITTDFNGDGKADEADLINTGAASSFLVVRLGNGDGTFATPLASIPVNSGEQAPGYYNIVAGDFNGDGKPDLAVVTYPSPNSGVSQITLFKGNGDGTFQAPLISQTGFGYDGNGLMFAADFNLDGKLDLAVNYDNSSQATVLLGNGDGTFQPSKVSYPGAIAGVGDLNGDGKPDLMTYLPANDSKLQVLLGKGDGTFLTPVTVPTGGGPGLVAIGDFNGDGKADLAVANGSSGNVGVLLGVLGRINLTIFRPQNGAWWVDPSSGAPITQYWGQTGDIPVTADYDHDGILDYAVYRPANGTWYVIPSATPNVPVMKAWGQAGDIPVPGDFDGDGKADYAVWRPASGTWFVILSSTGAVVVKPWGELNDIPVVGDFDGDGKTDYAVWRPSEGNWYITLSSTGATVVKAWGQAGDLPVAADFDGDGKTDFAVWRPSNGNWYIVPSSTGAAYVVNWGVAGDIPVPRDYDLDGKADVAVWRPSNGYWFITPSATPSATITVPWGALGDVPVYKPAGN